MDIDTTGYTVTESQEEAEKKDLRAHGYRLSSPIVIDGVYIGFLAVTFDSQMNVEQAAVVVVTEG